jgi:hypothetical protein
MTRQRELTPNEAKCLSLLRTLEDLIDTRKLVVTMLASREAADAAAKIGEAPFRKVDFDPAQQQFKLTYTVPNFKRYVEVVLKACGMTLMLDGSIKTYDNLTITNEYLN